jgi:hypothetical protein
MFTYRLPINLGLKVKYFNFILKNTVTLCFHRVSKLKIFVRAKDFLTLMIIIGKNTKKMLKLADTNLKSIILDKYVNTGISIVSPKIRLFNREDYAF